MPRRTPSAAVWTRRASIVPRAWSARSAPRVVSLAMTDPPERANERRSAAFHEGARRSGAYAFRAGVGAPLLPARPVRKGTGWACVLDGARSGRPRRAERAGRQGQGRLRASPRRHRRCVTGPCVARRLARCQICIERTPERCHGPTRKLLEGCDLVFCRVCFCRSGAKRNK